MSLSKKIRYLCFRLGRLIVGPAKVRLLTRTSSINEIFETQVVLGYSLNIYCEQRSYVKEYRYGILFNRHFFKYRIYAIPSPNAPEKLNALCQDVLYIKEPFNVHYFFHLGKRIAVGKFVQHLYKKSKEQ